MEFTVEMRIMLDVVIASILCGIIGFEREVGQKPLGMRTNMLVGGAVVMLVSLGEVIIIHYSKLGFDAIIKADPVRIIQAIIIGVSFIGAGTVLQIQSEYKIKFLTTATTILFSTGIGIGVALHQYYLAVTVTIFILLVNYVMAWIGRKLRQRSDSVSDSN